MIPEIAALKRLQELDEVAAAFVYNRTGAVLAAAVPKNYTLPVLEQLIGQFRRITDLVDKAKIRFREMRFSFDGFTVWMKVFGQDLTLVVFIQPKAAISPLRQPINLTVVNLEKAILGAADKREESPVESLANMAHRAEMELIREVRGGRDEIFMDRLGVLVEIFVGPHAQEVLGATLRDVEIGVTFDTRVAMLRLADMVSARISNVERRKYFLEAAGDLIDRMEFEFNSAESKSPGGVSKK
jgi:hypothetical protein